MDEGFLLSLNHDSHSRCRYRHHLSGTADRKKFGDDMVVFSEMERSILIVHMHGSCECKVMIFFLLREHERTEILEMRDSCQLL